MTDEKKLLPIPVGMFKEEGVKIVVYAKKGESPEDAIARVAKAHGLKPSQIEPVKSKE